MGSVVRELRILESLLPFEHGMIVFDAETQETSYGIALIGGLPYIFDTHRHRGRFVATIELLTEVVQPLRISASQVRHFGRSARTHGLLPIPYSACFFRENLHVYAFSGPVRGFDLAAIGSSLESAERRLLRRAEALWPEVPGPIARAQRDMLGGRRRVRHEADREVLLRRRAGIINPIARRRRAAKRVAPRAPRVL